MTELSPAARAVLDAINKELDEAPWDLTFIAGSAAAAALRAATELDAIKPQAVGPCDESYGSSTKLITMSEQELKYQVALAVKQAKVDTYRALRSIASELEGTKNA